MEGKLAILGGRPLFEEKMPINRPTLPKVEAILPALKEIFKTGMITNSKYVEKFEREVAGYLNVRNVVAVSSCTSGLMLTLKCVGLKGEVITPSNTFVATVHAIKWNNLEPILVDCDRATFNIDPHSVERMITDKTSAILAVHVHGNPCDISGLQRVAEKHKLKLFFDAAHAFGARHGNKHIGGNGEAEVFSLSPTKLLPVGEGGLVTTNNDELAEKIKLARNYGLIEGGIDCRITGLNARMEEFNAILGLSGLPTLDQNINARNRLAEMVQKRLSKIKGIYFQKVDKNCLSTYKDLVLLIKKEEFRLNRNELRSVLEKENIMTKNYFYPPIHKLDIYRDKFKKCSGKLPVTDYLSTNSLTIPLYSHMIDEEMEKICLTIEKAHGHWREIKRALEKDLISKIA